MKVVSLQTAKRSEFLDITQKIVQMIPENVTGVCVIFVPHTTAGITINEGADPAVQEDVLNYLDRSVPWDQPYFKHIEGNSAAHIKASIIGSSVTIIVKDGKLQMGTWQKIFFTEFDGPRRRKIWVTLNHLWKV